ncbi:MAG: tRNA uridine-5-carboxymethylaminomethyl(34) synthesis GTPase MnmE [Deltaproteobacteria bacterium]|nr:tRNA uridine-5-carboxymethylaminomethyl(34) synthesis GTPase MnmE [Deltaproteobacteria bacterium]
MIMDDTIAAISTPLGTGGIGIIRVSGPNAEKIARHLFKPSRSLETFESHHLYHGQIIAPETGSVLDDVLMSIMKKPHSYTGDDTLEINCHGGLLILQHVLNEVVKAGARLAEPGEFTKRAFLNNRMDLSQAEAIADMISAKTEKGLAIAVSQMDGRLRDRIEALKQKLVDILAEIEVSIDFSEDEREGESSDEIRLKIEEVITDLTALLAGYEQGKIYRQGLNIIIMGKPNVGKSSLLNRLLGEKRAIVTPIPGTTRDFIEESVNIHGLPVRLTDTAGIRKPKNLIEETGIGMVWEKIASTDGIIIVLDGSRPLSREDRDLLKHQNKQITIVAINKSDLPQKMSIAEVKFLQPHMDTMPLPISAKYGDGISDLKDRLYSLIMDDRKVDEYQPDILITGIRHKSAIEGARKRLLQAQNNITGSPLPELTAFDVREALTCLDDITGKTTAEDVLDRIFSQFCIGK